jgi:hypothetical protein
VFVLGPEGGEVGCVSLFSSVSIPRITTGEMDRGRLHSIKIVIRNPNQRIQMIRKTQYGWKRLSRIGQLSRSAILYSEERIQRIFDGYHVVCRNYDGRHCDGHICYHYSSAYILNLTSNFLPCFHEEWVVMVTKVETTYLPPKQSYPSSPHPPTHSSPP